ncbi:MAG: PP2C family protein-serine/threonine phosphatase, partial [Candidatus Acidiferrales bacterium]
AVSGKFSNKFVTAAYVYVDLEENLMRYAGAGHPPLMQYRNSMNKAVQILENGIVLGILEESTYGALEIPLEPGDRQVLYTDGILEAANPVQEMFGVEQFMRFLESSKSLNAGQFADALLAKIDRWTGQSSEQGQQDDLTLVLFDFKRP